jgi:hypothetical protein
MIFSFNYNYLIKSYVRLYNYVYSIDYWWAAIAQSVQRLPTGWTVRGSNPGVGEIFHTCPDRQ